MRALGGLWGMAVRLMRSHMGLYVFFGGCTTALNIVLFLLFFHACGWAAWFSNAMAWWPSVVFAWWTNRLWVFDARQGASAAFLARELASFAGSRLSTGMADVALIWLTVDVAGWDELAMKLLVGALVVGLNYVISRWLVFRKGRDEA